MLLIPAIAAASDAVEPPVSRLCATHQGCFLKNRAARPRPSLLPNKSYNAAKTSLVTLDTTSMTAKKGSRTKNRRCVRCGPQNTAARKF